MLNENATLVGVHKFKSKLFSPYTFFHLKIGTKCYFYEIN